MPTLSPVTASPSVSPTPEPSTAEPVESTGSPSADGLSGTDSPTAAGTGDVFIDRLLV